MARIRRRESHDLVGGRASGLARFAAAGTVGIVLSSYSWAQAPGSGSLESGDRTGMSERQIGNRPSEMPLPDQALPDKSTETSSPAPAAATPPPGEGPPLVAPMVSPVAVSPAADSPLTVAPAPSPSPPPAEKTTVPSASTAVTRSVLRLSVQPGAHLAAQKMAIHAPFVAQTGTSITVVPWPVEGNPLAPASAGRPAWDLAEVDSEIARLACDAGVIERIDTAILAKSLDSSTAEKDYIAGGLTPCAIASVLWSSLIAFDQRAWPAQSQGQPARGSKRPKTAPVAAARTPDKLKDVFDIATFPGKRAFRRSPRYLLEMSLIADGVAPEDVYRALAGEEGTYRAFARLEALRGQINWVETPAAASRQLAEKSAVMAMVYSGRAFQNVAVEGKVQGLIWEGQLYHLNAWVVAKGSPQSSTRAFLGVASDPANLAAQATLFPYGPPRASAIAKVGRHPVLKADMASYLPTAPANLRTALQFDARFWGTHEGRLNAAFEAWLKAPLPTPTRSAAPSPAVSPSEAPAQGTGSSPGSTGTPAAPPVVGEGKPG